MLSEAHPRAGHHSLNQNEKYINIMIQVYNLAVLRSRLIHSTSTSRPRILNHVRNKIMLKMDHSEVDFSFWVNVLLLGQLTASSPVIHTPSWVPQSGAREQKPITLEL